MTFSVHKHYLLTKFLFVKLSDRTMIILPILFCLLVCLVRKMIVAWQCTRLLCVWDILIEIQSKNNLIKRLRQSRRYQKHTDRSHVPRCQCTAPRHNDFRL